MLQRRPLGCSQPSPLAMADRHHERNLNLFSETIQGVRILQLRSINRTTIRTNGFLYYFLKIIYPFVLIVMK